VDSYKASAFGALPPATNRRKSLRKVQQILSFYPMIHNLSVDEIISILSQELSNNEAKKFAEELYEHTYESLNEEFVESYLFEENDRVFEDKTGEIFRAIGFQVDMRPKPLDDNVRTEIEILIHIDENTICIIDAKNYSEKF